VSALSGSLTSRPGSAALGAAGAASGFTPWTAAATTTAGIVSGAGPRVVRHAVARIVNAAERVVRERTGVAALTVRLQLL
jgi:hypothetical protein